LRNVADAPVLRNQANHCAVKPEPPHDCAKPNDAQDQHELAEVTGDQQSSQCGIHEKREPQSGDPAGDNPNPTANCAARGTRYRAGHLGGSGAG
jgi:hypothetical protein